MAALQKALTDLTLLEAEITRLENSVQRLSATEGVSSSAVQVQNNNAKRTQQGIAEVYQRILNTNPEDPSAYISKYGELCDKIDIQLAVLIELQQPQQQPQQVTPQPTNSHVQQHIRLPELRLPEFKGDFDDWPAFEDIFTATIRDNKSLSNAQKLQYLQAYTKSAANNLISGFKVTDSNYDEAWQTLKNYYKNDREIIYSHIRKLLHYTPLKAQSATSLQSLLNHTMECVRSLKALECPTDKWDHLLVVITLEKMDPDSKSEWAKSLTGTEPTTFKDFTTFLERHIRSLNARGLTSSRQDQPAKAQLPHKGYSKSNQPKSHFVSSATLSCSLCQASHNIYHCQQFLDMSPAQRGNFIRKDSRCFNCLSKGHSIKQCPSKNVCKKCNKWHNTLLHLQASQEFTTTQATNATNASTSSSISTNHASTAFTSPSQVLLKNAIVYIRDKFGNKQPCRAFLDDGSEAGFITEACAAALSLPRTRTDTWISGVGQANLAHARWFVTARLESATSHASIDIEAFILRKVTSKLPSQPINPDQVTQWPHLKGLTLADPQAYSSQDIDILLGADIIAEIVLDGIRRGPSYTPTATNTIFGWVLFGRINLSQRAVVQANCSRHATLEDLVQRFWKMEELPATQVLTKEERECEQHFSSNTVRQHDGRYQVRLPFRSNLLLPPSGMGDSRKQAEFRLLALERRFSKYPQHHQAYIDFMREYLALGHMEPAQPTTNPAYYIPHHFVLKEDSTTTKLRVVFDASAKSTTGVSLNSTLMVGATIQSDLFSILLRFRLHQVALKADIKQMYRQFTVHPHDRDFQRILWREDSTKPIEEYRLNTVTYGTSSAPFLATRCLQQLAHDVKEKYPAASAALYQDPYVDDIISGADTTSEAITLTHSLIAACQSAGMDMRKWVSSSQEVLDSIPKELHESQEAFTFDQDSAIKALGIAWLPKPDVVTFFSRSNPTATTKRSLLSEISKTFDPLGWLAPVTISSKILFQDLWQQKLDWDDSLSKEHQLKWTELQQQLHQLNQLSIPRCVVLPAATNFTLFGFSDASEKAFAACVYLRSKDSHDNSTCHLLAAKTKVAPLQKKSLPRLELDGALLLAELMDSINNALKLNCHMQCYTDSMIVLKWLSASPRRWKTYVANRVASIQEIIPAENWFHVPGTDNPADAASRGITVESLLHHSLWWNGPSWLITGEQPLADPSLPSVMESVLAEEKPKSVLHVQTTTPWLTQWIQRFSTLQKLVSATAVMQRFKQYIMKRSIAPAPILPEERAATITHLIQHEQHMAFKQEIHALQSHTPLPTSSKLSALCPIIDQHGTLRVGGRLQNSALPSSAKTPAILPKTHLTTLIVRDCHIRHMHSGLTLTIAAIQQQYWIIGARDFIRLYIRKCISCRKVRAEKMQQQMGQLPQPRVTAYRPFLHSGVDFAGPYNIKMRTGRGSAADKVYFAVFVCMSTKAVHLEAVTSLSTEAFIASFRRFVARRGLCSHLYSDCGKNFVGAEKELRTQLKQIEAYTQQQLAHLGTTFHFNPPSAPHQGGLWEAAVKSTKAHLKHVIGKLTLSFEQFQTLLCNVEACLNSRPLCSLSSDSTDMQALTPGHFLVGEPLTAIPDPALTHIPTNRLNYWQTVQQLSQQFWTRWRNEYLTTLQQRAKWTRKQANVCVGDLVILTEDNMHPTHWRLGRVAAFHPGRDGLVRKATITYVINPSSTPVTYGKALRPIQKLSLLLSSNETN